MKAQAYRCPSCNSNDIYIDQKNRMHCVRCGTTSQLEENPEILHGKTEYRKADAEYVRAQAEYIDAGTRRNVARYRHKEWMFSATSDRLENLGHTLLKVLIVLYNVLRRPVMLALWVLAFPLLVYVLPWPSLLDGLRDGLLNLIGQWLFNAFCFLVLFIGGLFVIVKLWSNNYDIDYNRFGD